jgi:hypothetical protein
MLVQKADRGLNPELSLKLAGQIMRLCQPLTYQQIYLLLTKKRKRSKK